MSVSTKERSKKYRMNNKQRIAAIAKGTARKLYLAEYNKTHRNQLRVNSRKWKYKVKYGLTPEQWDAIFESQGRSCAICRATTSGSKNHWATDHDHESLKVRGILCDGCNKGLGSFKDSPEYLQKAIEYLKGNER
jgi:Recombination endonuclease VII